MPYRQQVAIQERTEVRSNTGGVTYTYATVAGKESIPALIVPMTLERRGEQMTVLTDTYAIHLAGDHSDVVPEMVVLDGEGVYDIQSVAPTMRRRVTEVVAKLVSI
jgi:hypothetical protein